MRHELMLEIIENITAECKHYTDGLTLDVECLNKIIDICMQHYEHFNKCDVCGETKSFDEMTRSGYFKEHTWRPLCKDCEEKIGRLFCCVWGEGYMKDRDATVENHPFDFFSLDNGYTGEHMMAIDKLVVGACYEIFDGIAAMHSIVRIR